MILRVIHAMYCCNGSRLTRDSQFFTLTVKHDIGVWTDIHDITCKENERQDVHSCQSSELNEARAIYTPRPLIRVRPRKTATQTFKQEPEPNAMVSLSSAKMIP